MWENQETDVMWNWPNQAQQSRNAGNTPNWWDRNRDWVIPAGQALLDAGAAVYSRNQNRKAEERAAALQREFAQNGIRWRVEDARAAGLHPLAALGMQPVQANPVVIPDALGPGLAEAGQNISRAMLAAATPYERRMQELQLKLLESQVDETDARAVAARAQAFRDMTEGRASTPIPLEGGFGGGALGETLTNEGIEIVGQHVNKPPNSFMPSEMDSSVGANINPLWSRFRIGKNQEMVLPGGISGDAAEALESLAESPILMYMTYRENVARYPGFNQFLIDRYGFQFDVPDGVSDNASLAFEIFKHIIRRGGVK